MYLLYIIDSVIPMCYNIDKLQNVRTVVKYFREVLFTSLPVKWGLQLGHQCMICIYDDLSHHTIIFKLGTFYKIK